METHAEAEFMPSDTLAAALIRHGFALAPEQVAKLDEYCQQLWSWNEKLNLTRHTDYEKFVSRDVVDSSRLAAHLQAGETVVDVGSGGGVPGIVIAILRPDVKVVLTESIEKKARVLGEMVAKLGLDCRAFHGRAEEYLKEQKANVVMGRAVGSLRKILGWFDGHWSQFDRMLLIKGPKWVEERGEARHYGALQSLELRKVDEYPMPGTESNSVILKLWPKDRAEPA